MKKLLIAFTVLLSLPAFSQRCGNDALLEHLKNTIPGFEARHHEMMDYIFNPETPQTLFNRNPQQPHIVVTIPVVFHVLYKNSFQNISDAQILSQLTVLNNDYRKLNADFNTVVPAVFRPLGADVEIVFCKATKDPNGNATTGIIRKAVASTFVLENDYFSAAGDLPWDHDKYLNIWIGRFTNPNYLGQATPPSVLEFNYQGDGLCIGDQFTGTTGTATAPYNKGRTATHEIGHYFGLLHPWGADGVTCGHPYINEWTPYNDDRVADTPETNNPYSGCPTFPSNLHACTTTSTGSMFMNYMDYVNDACMAFFTLGQKTVMQNTLAGPRVSLLTSNGCGTLGLSEFEANQAISVYPNPVAKDFMISSPQSEIDEVEIYNAIGQIVKTQKLKQTNNLINIEELASGTYYLRIYSQGKFLKSDKIIKK